jgi:hypothetical protein
MRVAFEDVDSPGHRADQPAVLFDVMFTEDSMPTQSCLLSLQDLAMAISSLQRGLLRLMSQPSIDVKISNAKLPVLVLPDESEVTTRFGDLCVWLAGSLARLPHPSWRARTLHNRVA